MLDEDKLNNETGVGVKDTTEDYLATINELKSKSVDKAEYEKLRAENKRLMQSIIDGKRIEAEEPKQEVVKDINELRSELFKSEIPLSNIEYCKKALELREEVMKKGGVDPFVPQGKKIKASFEDKAAAQRVADVLQECIDISQGDNAIFTMELQRRTDDVLPM